MIHLLSLVLLLSCTLCTIAHVELHLDPDASHYFSDERTPIKESYSNIPDVSSIPTITQKRQLKPSKSNKLSPRSQSWLDSHNTRRKKYHTKYKSSYIPLQWSDSLAKQAEDYAKKLIQKCGTSGGLAHDTNTQYGENLATGYGKIPPDTDSVLKRWVEDEEKNVYPKNGHFTQVLWRATEYVGCGEAGVPIKKNRELRRAKEPKNGGGGRGKKKPNRGKTAKNAKGGKRGKTNNKNEGKGNGGKGNAGKGQGKADKDEDAGGFECQIQVCRYARYVSLSLLFGVTNRFSIY